MKTRLIIIAIVLAVLMLFGFRYMVVETDDALPDEVRLTLEHFFGHALAETEPPLPAETPEPTLQSTPEPTPEPTPVPTPEPVLETGDSGDEVKAVQQRLKDLGFLTSAADGKFGPKTEQAVIDFKSHLYELDQERAAAEAAAEAAAQAAAEADMQEESEEPEAAGEILQEEDGRPEPADAEIPEESGGAEPSEPLFDGKVDEETYRLLAEKGFDEYQAKLSAGSRGAEVRRMQGRLKTLGFLTGKADGIFGKQTAHAVTSFQKQHKLTQDGVAGEKTQRALYSAAAKKYVPPVPAQPKGKPYLLKVSTKDQRVYAYSWNAKEGAYTTLARTMVCSTGLADTPTPKGTYTNTNPVVRWGYFPKYDVWAQYLYRISGPYLFHSVLYDEADESTVKWGSVNKLGSPASHGCIRLSVEDARWIYNNCPAGTTVTVY